VWGLITTAPPVVELTVPERNCRNRDGLIVHRVHALDAADRAHVRGIPVTIAGTSSIRTPATSCSG